MSKSRDLDREHWGILINNIKQEHIEEEQLLQCNDCFYIFKQGITNCPCCHSNNIEHMEN